MTDLDPKGLEAATKAIWDLRHGPNSQWPAVTPEEIAAAVIRAWEAHKDHHEATVQRLAAVARVELVKRDQMMAPRLSEDQARDLYCQHLEAHVKALETALRRIDGMNDHPAWFRKELNDILRATGLIGRDDVLAAAGGPVRAAAHD